MNDHKAKEEDEDSPELRLEKHDSLKEMNKEKEEPEVVEPIKKTPLKRKHNTKQRSGKSLSARMGIKMDKN